jgi:hypothetical protein
MLMRTRGNNLRWNHERKTAGIHQGRVSYSKYYGRILALLTAQTEYGTLTIPSMISMTVHEKESSLRGIATLSSARVSVVKPKFREHDY